MIEGLTREEIDQLRKEIASYDREIARTKESLYSDLKLECLELMKGEVKQAAHGVVNSITMICDFALGNYTINDVPRAIGCKSADYRKVIYTTAVKRGRYLYDGVNKERYAAMYKDLVAVLKKYREGE